jgi:hypothetical protein
MAMPETSVDEHGQAVTRQYKVRLSREIISMKAETQPYPVSNLPHFHFGRGVSTTNLRHVCAPVLGVEMVHRRCAPVFYAYPKLATEAADQQSHPLRPLCDELVSSPGGAGQEFNDLRN